MDMYCLSASTKNLTFLYVSIFKGVFQLWWVIPFFLIFEPLCLHGVGGELSCLYPDPLELRPLLAGRYNILTLKQLLSILLILL